MSDADRIRWRCRRGMLELDLVLTSFLESQLDNLDDAQLDAFEATGNVTYRMLAEELVLHTMRTLWDEPEGGFFDRAPDPESDVGLLQDRLKPFAANCIAARLLYRTARLCGREALAAVRHEAADAGPLAAELVLALTATAG